MKSREDIDHDIEDISKILSIWDYRIENPLGIPESFHVGDYQTLLTKTITAQRTYDIPLSNGLPLNYDRLTPNDVAVSLVAGAIGAVMPKLTANFFDGVHDYLSHANGILGKLFNQDGEWIDTNIIKNGQRVVKGKFHRFRPDGKHDLLNFAGLVTSWQQFGFLSGTLKYITHLGLDSCSQTGIPVPGSTNFLYWIREHFGMKLFGQENQSEFAGIRMADILQAGATQGVIAIYSHYEKIPKDSLRIPQLGIFSHGISIAGSTWIACNTNNPKMLSKISYPASALFAKNCWRFYRDLNAISKNVDALDKEINELINVAP